MATSVSMRLKPRWRKNRVGMPVLRMSVLQLRVHRELDRRAGVGARIVPVVPADGYRENVAVLRDRTVGRLHLAVVLDRRKRIGDVLFPGDEILAGDRAFSTVDAERDVVSARER